MICSIESGFPKTTPNMQVLAQLVFCYLNKTWEFFYCTWKHPETWPLTVSVTEIFWVNPTAQILISKSNFGGHHCIRTIYYNMMLIQYWKIVVLNIIEFRTNNTLFWFQRLQWIFAYFAPDVHKSEENFKTFLYRKIKIWTVGFSQNTLVTEIASDDNM